MIKQSYFRDWIAKYCCLGIMSAYERIVIRIGIAMTELDQKIAAAFKSEGKQEDVQQVYLTLLRTPLFVPVQKEHEVMDDEPFRPLFAKIDDHYFLIAFDTEERLKTWASGELDKIAFVELSGRDMIAGMNDQVYLALNVGTECYKEFTPDEIKRLKMIISKIDQLKQIASLSVGEVAMSTITYGELLFGAEKSHHPKKTKEILQEITSLIPPLPMATDVGQMYGDIRNQLEKKGKIIGNNDLWIAAHALSLDLTLVTNNTKEFSRVAKLKLENWVF